MFTKQHYKAIAGIVEQNAHKAEIDQTESFWIVANIARDLADYFTKDNLQFDRDRFLVACGIE